MDNYRTLKIKKMIEAANSILAVLFRLSAFASCKSSFFDLFSKTRKNNDSKRHMIPSTKHTIFSIYSQVYTGF